VLKACLNGARPGDAHPAIPLTPDQLAAEARAAVDAGADALHIHPRDDRGRETLDAVHIDAAVLAVRAAVDVPVGVSTGAWIVEAAADRLSAVRSWSSGPDFASVNVHEDGAAALAETLVSLGIGVEAGLWTPRAAVRLREEGWADRCLRILLEPIEDDLDVALPSVEAMLAELDGVAPHVARLLHGHDSTTWVVLERAVELGYDTRIGLEDSLADADGRPASGNAALVEAARRRTG